jgi:hypothetical protein
VKSVGLGCKHATSSRVLCSRDILIFVCLFASLHGEDRGHICKLQIICPLGSGESMRFLIGDRSADVGEEITVSLRMVVSVLSRGGGELERKTQQRKSKTEKT